MRAAMVTEFTGPEGISVQELADPTPKKGQVVVKVAAAGVNFPDLLMTRDMYQLKPPPPLELLVFSPVWVWLPGRA